MVKAIQVLRIHLLELEKVSDLCKDFCSRYIACLKTKMNSETLLSGEPGSPYSPGQGQIQSFSPTKTQVRPVGSSHTHTNISAEEHKRHMRLCLQTSSSMSGTISPQGQIVVPASALQQGNVTVTAVNPTQVVAGMSPWHTTPPSGTKLWEPSAETLLCSCRPNWNFITAAAQQGVVNSVCVCVFQEAQCTSLLQSSLLRVRW